MRVTRRGLFGVLGAVTVWGAAIRSWLALGSTTLPQKLTIYNMDNTAEINKPICVFDANGKQYYHTLECCVETGEICRQVQKNGKRYIDEQAGVVLEEIIWVPAPLKIVPRDQCRNNSHPGQGGIPEYEFVHLYSNPTNILPTKNTAE